MKYHRRTRRPDQRGQSLVEFALVLVLLTPILLSVISIGFNIARAIQVTQIVRDTDNMYARAVDFSQNGNQQLLVMLTSGLGMTQTGGTGVLILSKVTYIADADCTGAGLTLAQCTNDNQYVITQRIVVGNPAFHTSAFGTPGSIASDGDVNNYLTDSSARATGFGNVLQLTSGNFAFVTEGFFKGLAWTVPNTTNINLISRRYFF